MYHEKRVVSTLRRQKESPWRFKDAGPRSKDSKISRIQENTNLE